MCIHEKILTLRTQLFLSQDAEHLGAAFRAGSGHSPSGHSSLACHGNFLLLPKPLADSLLPRDPHIFRYSSTLQMQIYSDQGLGQFEEEGLNPIRDRKSVVEGKS